ncbi:MAG: alanine--tRNA ligase [Candidatus Njordarchaeia archaeon]
MVDKEKLKELFGKNEYEVDFFKEMGFVRKKCKVCGNYFWTLDPDRETCGDVECEGLYRFIEGRKWNPKWDIHETIRKWIDFFKERDHEPLDPYPVVARWRDDIEFTIASIAVFQPWVVNGIVDPPANPLVIPQPCLRFGGEFSDIDNIGKTGRHLTSFTMGGQHAFNSRKFRAYWKDTYVRYNFDFMTKLLGIPKEELVYKEDVWAGGGNFGPSLETFAYGLELVNGVFMQYKFTSDGYKPLDLKVLDVGWGLERVSWFMQRTPTIYEATFGPVYEWLRENLGVTVDNSLLVEYAKLSGMLDTKSPEKFKASRGEIAKLIGVDIDYLNEVLGPLEAVYAILDHTKTLALAVPDGGIPSNVGGYYNLRVIIRRALTLAEKYNFDVDWEELLYKQIDFFSKTFKRMREGKPVIFDIWNEETKRYRKTITKGISEIKRIVKKHKIKVLKYPQLRDLYINFGIPPETVEEIGKKIDVEVDIPPNFYDLIRVEKIPKGEEISEFTYLDKIEEKFEEIAKNLPETRKLYYEDRYLKQFEAKVVYADDKFIALDRTAFYPGGGGQDHDTGIIKVGDKTFKVARTFKIMNVIFHEVDKSVSDVQVGEQVFGEIDWERRYALMRHHTATHVINGAAVRVLGPHVWQVGADKREDRARLDISHYKNLTLNEIKQIERLANKIVFEGRPVITEVLDRTSAEKKYGVRIYQGGAVPEKFLRIINIKDWDVEACGGTHLNNTSEIGLIKITNVRKIHDGVVRITFVAGDKALDYIDQEEEYLREACEVLRVNSSDLPKTVERFFKEWKEQQNVIKRLANELVNSIRDLAKKHEKNLRGMHISIFRVDLPPQFMINAIKNLSGSYDLVAISGVYMGNTILAISGDASKLEKIESTLVNHSFKCNKIKFGKLCNTAKMDANRTLKLVEKILTET